MLTLMLISLRRNGAWFLEIQFKMFIKNKKFIGPRSSCTEWVCRMMWGVGGIMKQWFHAFGSCVELSKTTEELINYLLLLVKMSLSLQVCTFWETPQGKIIELTLLQIGTKLPSYWKWKLTVISWKASPMPAASPWFIQLWRHWKIHLKVVVIQLRGYD